MAIGTVRAFLHCTDIGDCADEYDANAVHYLRVRWSRGATLRGSSGSGLFSTDGRLLGVLAGGPSCNAPRCRVDDYGRITHLH